MLLVLLAVAVHGFSERFVDWSVCTLWAKVTPSALWDSCISAVETGLHNQSPESAEEAGGTLAMYLVALAPAALCICTYPMLSAMPAMAYSAQPGFAMCKQCVQYSMRCSPAVRAGEDIAVGAIKALFAQVVAAATPRRRTIDLK